MFKSNKLVSPCNLLYYASYRSFCNKLMEIEGIKFEYPTREYDFLTVHNDDIGLRIFYSYETLHHYSCHLYSNSMKDGIGGQEIWISDKVSMCVAMEKFNRFMDECADRLVFHYTRIKENKHTLMRTYTWKIHDNNDRIKTLQKENDIWEDEIVNIERSL